ncbi:zinc-finger protein [Rhyzopertha dominica]|nr:zinc-finger protein [Rhyzopertha dominica]
MAGSLNELQAKIKNDAPNALFTHCHRLNLVLKNGSRSIKNSRIFFRNLNITSEIFQPIRKTHVCFRFGNR